jgi:2,5-diamino-6-(ribosylamino)-4(3H)-pyrimidinone 5'-phosphate reductase
VEGGGTVIWGFLRNGMVDDLYVYIGPCIIGGKNTPTMASGEGIMREDERITLKIVRTQRMGAGVLIHYQPCLLQ